jgi:hypothetical protein
MSKPFVRRLRYLQVSLLYRRRLPIHLILENDATLQNVSIKDAKGLMGRVRYRQRDPPGLEARGELQDYKLAGERNICMRSQLGLNRCFAASVSC